MVIQEERSVFWEVIVPVIAWKTVDMNTCLRLKGYQDRVVWTWLVLFWIAYSSVNPVEYGATKAKLHLTVVMTLFNVWSVQNATCLNTCRICGYGVLHTVFAMEVPMLLSKNIVSRFQTAEFRNEEFSNVFKTWRGCGTRPSAHVSYEREL